jgi:integrase
VIWRLSFRFRGLAGRARVGAVWLAFAAGVGFEGGGAEGFEPGEELVQAAVVVDPCLVVAVLVGAEPAADGFGGDLAGPLVVGAVEAGRVGVAGAVAAAAAGAAFADRAGQHHAGGGDGGEFGGDLLGLGLVAGGDTHGFRVAQVRDSGHVLLYMYSVTRLARTGAAAPLPASSGPVAAYIARWRPSSVSAEAAAFAREVTARTAPQGRERAKNLLWAAGKLADYGLGLGLEPAAGVLLHPSVTERFTRCAPGLSGAARRTLRTNLRFIGRRVVPQFYPADLPLPRERSKQPYSRAEIGGFLALADAQPMAERRMRAAGLICLGAGAGLIRGGLREARGTDVACRSGGVVVTVRGARPRTVPVLSRYQDRLLAAAAFAGAALICGGTDPGRRNITNPLAAALDGGTGLPRLDTSRLRATWLADCADLLGLAAFMRAAGISCSQRLGDLVAGLEPAGEEQAVRLLGAARP